MGLGAPRGTRGGRRISQGAGERGPTGGEPQRRIFDARQGWPDLSVQRLFQLGFELAHGLNARL